MKKVQLKIDREWFSKIKDGIKWMEIRKKDLDIKKGDMIEFIDTKSDVLIGSVILSHNVSILDKGYFLSLDLVDSQCYKYGISDTEVSGYGICSDYELDWVENYLENSEKVYLYNLDLKTFKYYPYNRFVFMLNVYNDEYWENKAVFKSLDKAKVALKVWKKAEPESLFSIIRWELENRNFGEDAFKTIFEES